jgi:hypothetical protein
MTAYLGIFSDHRQTEIGMLHRDLFIKSKPCCNLSFSPRIHEQIILREIFKKYVFLGELGGSNMICLCP